MELLRSPKNKFGNIRYPSLKYIDFLQGFESWVLSDYTASGQGELSVQRGQQVEVLEPASGSTSTAMVVVRLFGQKEEGMIPLTCLKQPTGGLKYRNVDGKINSVFNFDKYVAGYINIRLNSICSIFK